LRWLTVRGKELGGTSSPRGAAVLHTCAAFALALDVVSRYAEL